jgi:hypothetical protein
MQELPAFMYWSFCVYEYFPMQRGIILFFILNFNDSDLMIDVIKKEHSITVSTKVVLKRAKSSSGCFRMWDLTYVVYSMVCTLTFILRFLRQRVW